VDFWFSTVRLAGLFEGGSLLTLPHAHGIPRRRFSDPMRPTVKLETLASPVFDSITIA
jgi:hypothetical protein